MKELCIKTVEALQRRGFDAEYVADENAAAARVLKIAAEQGARTLGTGGSATVKALGLVDSLKAAGLATFGHGDPREQVAELYLLSANALTADGRIVNIDGACNRISASVWGPKQVVFIIGRNKIVEGGIDAAIARAKKFACPPNCRRLERKTPCAETGVCVDCDSPDRICKVTMIMERRPTRTPTIVLVVDADLGF